MLQRKHDVGRGGSRSPLLFFVCVFKLCTTRQFNFLKKYQKHPPLHPPSSVLKAAERLDLCVAGLGDDVTFENRSRRRRRRRRYTGSTLRADRQRRRRRETQKKLKKTVCAYSPASRPCICYVHVALEQRDELVGGDAAAASLGLLAALVALLTYLLPEVPSSYRPSNRPT